MVASVVGWVVSVTAGIDVAGSVICAGAGIGVDVDDAQAESNIITIIQPKSMCFIIDPLVRLLRIA